MELKKVNRRTLEGLVLSGGMDVFGETRATLMATLPAALKIAEQHSRDAEAGIQDLFGITPAVEQEKGPGTYHRLPEWQDEQRLHSEKQSLGLYLTGHPINQYLPELKQFTSSRIAELKPNRNQTIVVAGLVVALRTMNTRRGDKMAFITIDDRSARIELAVFAEGYQRHRDLLLKDKLIVVEGEVSIDDYSGGYKMSAKNIYDIDQAREHFAKSLLVRVDQQKAGNGFVSALQKTLQPYREGFCQVVIGYESEQARAQIPLGEGWSVHPTDELLHRLRDLAGSKQIDVIY